MKRHRDFGDELGRRLHDERPGPSERLLEAIVSQIGSPKRDWAPRASFRVAFAGALTVMLVTAVAAVGGVGYASKSVKSAVHAVQHLVSATPTVRTRASASAPTAALSQYTGAPPVIEKFAPTKTCGGVLMTITGDQFQVITSVTIGGAAASFTVNSNNKITATVPNAADDGSVTVSGSNGTDSRGGFSIAAPTVRTFTPSKGSVGTSVDLTGSCFTNATKVTFHGTSAGFTVNSHSSITATVPPGAKTGLITVRTPHGSAHSKKKFTVTG